MRKVVVTGMGMVTPLGRGLSVNQKGIMAGRSVISKVESFDMTDYPSQIAGQISRGDLDGQFSPNDVLEMKEQRHMDDFI
ncbi:MAG: beta-ketoacyl-ACP synthase II, partial [Alphaproteobacteria bacterium]|nr:beta-ketoacyl-ACP synthase II [Alphaproteobacteria bacterium]